MIQNIANKYPHLYVGRQTRDRDRKQPMISLFLSNTSTLIAFVSHRWEHLIFPVCVIADASLRGLSETQMPTCQAISNQNECRK